MRQQVIVIHGGDSFETYDEFLHSLETKVIDERYLRSGDWKSSLEDDLGDTFQVIAPTMPNKQNARYKEWKIWFEKFIPFIQDNAIFVGHSMGGIFLAKYFSENNFPKNVKAIIMVAAPFEDFDGEKLCDFNFATDCKALNATEAELILFHSTDDPVVPFDHALLYQKLLPQATLHTFTDRYHFWQQSFPEILYCIKELS
jgi:predicted alpha/beta hydrolase family esterase